MLSRFEEVGLINDGAFAAFADKEVRGERMLYLEHEKPLRFGNNAEHGIRLKGFSPEIVFNAADDEGLLVHDAKTADLGLANILVGMDYPDFPVPVGIFRDIERQEYASALAAQLAQASERKGPGDLAALLRSNGTWMVAGSN